MADLLAITDIENFSEEDIRNVISMSFHHLRDDKCLYKTIEVNADDLDKFMNVFKEYCKTHNSDKISLKSFKFSDRLRYSLFYIYVHDFARDVICFTNTDPGLVKLYGEQYREENAIFAIQRKSIGDTYSNIQNKLDLIEIRRSKK